MLSLNLPSFEAKIKTQNEKKYIYDILRKRFIALTPEENVRQHFVHFLLSHKNYPAALMANEVAISLNGTKKRCDTVLYKRDLTPRLVIEYKAPTVEITQAVFDQIARYNIVLRVEYLIVSNGINHYCCKIDYANQKYVFLKDVPSYPEL